MATGAELALIISARDQAEGPIGAIRGHLNSLASAATAPIRAIGGITDALCFLHIPGRSTIMALTSLFPFPEPCSPGTGQDHGPSVMSGEENIVY